MELCCLLQCSRANYYDHVDDDDHHHGEDDDDDDDDDDGNVHLYAEFPTFLDYFKQLRDADASYASTCNSHWRQFMQGPPNKPNVDEYGLIHVVCHFLKSCEDGVY